MTRLDASVRLAAIIAAIAVSVLALAGAWSLTTRTTALATVGGAVLRENLISGQASFCRPPVRGDAARCVRVSTKPDFSDRATV